MSRGRIPVTDLNPTIQVQADGVSLGRRSILDFTGMSLTDNASSGSVQIAGGLRVLHRDVTLVTVENSATEVDLVSYDIPADTLDIDGRKLVVEQRGDIFNNGLSRNMTFRVYLGGVAIYEDVLSLGSISARRPFWWRTEVVRIGAGSQMMYGRFLLAAPDNTGPAIGTAGGFTQGEGQAYALLTEGLTEDDSAAIELRTSIQQASATINMNTRQQTYQVHTE